MKQYKEQLTGTGMVFRFTLQQFLKNKANIIALVIILLFSVASVPLMALLSGQTGSAPHSAIEHVYFKECTEPYALTCEDLQSAAKANDYWANTGFQRADGPGAPALTPNDAYASVEANPETGMYDLTVTASEDTALDESDLNSLGGFLTGQFDQARYRTLSISAEQLDFVMAPWTSDTEFLDDYLEDENRWQTQYWLQLIYSIVVMMVSVMSVSYIIRTVIEEKASKLIELLMVSVKPLALIVGKILASMTYVLLSIGCMIGGYLLSHFVCGLFMDVPALSAMLSSTSIGFSGDLMHLNATAVIAAVVSLLLAFLTFSIIAGLSATGCSSTEDTNGATTGVTFLIMFGYIVAMFAGTSSSPALAHITSIVPVISVFCAPVNFMMGSVGIGVLILSWALQAIVIVALAILCARIYSGLLMHRGNRVKFGEMLSMAKASAKAPASKEVH